MKNQKALMITIALLLALLGIGSVSAAGSWYTGKGDDTSQRFARTDTVETPRLGSPVGESKGEIQRLRALINANNDKIANLKNTLKESKTTSLDPGAKKDIKREIRALKDQNKEYEREIQRLTKKPRS
jgi:predicted RNase H-like nuclease (RuvC/YqgF family)